MYKIDTQDHFTDETVEEEMSAFDPNYKTGGKRRYLLWSSVMLLIMVLTALTTVLMEKDPSDMNYASYFNNQNIGTTIPRQKLTNITYDDQAIVIDGKRQLLIVGAIHYPRSSPGMWNHLLKHAKEAGINTIDTYVFWNLHEPKEGQFDFEDLIGFLKATKDEGLWVNLRIGPYICAEWNFGGFPFWIKEIVGLTARTWNQPFMDKMETFVRKTVQVVDEYIASKGDVIKSYGDDGERYISWAADLANSLDTGVPWIMCLSEGINTVITTCNGDNWIGPHSASTKQPSMFTELWSGWFQHWDDPKPIRRSEDLALSTARFIVKGGTYVSYYMWHGGTNFGRNGGDYQTTSYDYDAPMSEYGFPTQPKYDHLKKLHLLFREFKDLFLYSKPKFINAGWGKEIHVFGDISNRTAHLIIFSNYRDKNSGTFKFEQKLYIVPKWSVQFYRKSNDDDFLELLYSTSRIPETTTLARTDPERTDLIYSIGGSNSSIEWIPETIGIWDASLSRTDTLQEHLSITKDQTDYLWYSLSNISLELSEIKPIMVNIKSVTDVWYIWVDNVLMFPHAISVPTSLNMPQEISAFLASSSLSSSKTQSHNITILSAVMGLKNYGPWYDSVKKGLSDSMVYLNGKELSKNNWAHQAGIKGEKLEYYNPDMVQGWMADNLPIYSPFVWYRIRISHLAIKELIIKAGVQITKPHFISFGLKMTKMGKGQIWVNGHSIGRYWDIIPDSSCKKCDYAGGFYDHKCLTNCGAPSQSYYHVPYDWLIKYNAGEMQDAIIVVFEEKGGNPNEIDLIMLN